MVGKQVNAVQPQTIHHQNHQTDILFVVVDPWYHGKSYDDAGMGCYQRCEVREDCLVSHTCGLSMPRGIHQLDVIQEHVNLVHHSQQFPLVSHPAGLDRSRYAFALAGLEQALQECRLHEGLATGERDAAARLLEENAIPYELAHHFCHRHGPSRDRPDPGETDVDTPTTCGTCLGGPGHSTYQ